MRLASIRPETDITISCDGYVPLIAKTVGYPEQHLKRCRIGDDNTLIEIGLDYDSGAICKITVVSLAAILSTASIMADCATVETGVPCVIHDECANNALRHVNISVTAALLGNRLVLQFGPSKAQLAFAIRNGRVVFQVDQFHTIYGIEFRDLSAKELEDFRYAVGVIA